VYKRQAPSDEVSAVEIWATVLRDPECRWKRLAPVATRTAIMITWVTTAPMAVLIRAKRRSRTVIPLSRIAACW